LPPDSGFQKTRVFLKSPTQWVFWGFYWVFLDKQEKIGKIIQKLSKALKALKQ